MYASFRDSVSYVSSSIMLILAYTYRSCCYTSGISSGLTHSGGIPHSLSIVIHS